MGAIKNLWFSIIGFFSSVMNCGHRIISLEPVAYLKSLTNRNDPHSSHRAVNITWGLGSFIMFWGSYLFQLYRDINFRLGITDYLFIATMAGMSTLSAIAAKQGLPPMDNSTPPVQPTPTSVTTTTVLSHAAPPKATDHKPITSQVLPQDDETP